MSTWDSPRISEKENRNQLPDAQTDNGQCQVKTGFGFHSHGDTGYPNSWMVYNGKSDLEMDNLGVPLFQETSIYMYIVLTCSYHVLVSDGVECLRAQIYVMLPVSLLVATVHLRHAV